MRRFCAHLGVLLAYTLLTLFFTYPISLSFFDAIPGYGGDANIFIWNLWWMKKALTELHTNPFWTDFLFFPDGVSLVFHSLVPLQGLLSLPLQPLLGLIATNNLFVLLSFVLSAYGTYLLIDFLVGDRRAAFVGGVIFAFCPYKFAHLLGHFNLTATQWLPFYILFLLKLIDSNAPKTAGLSLACALMLLFNAYTEPYYLFYALLFSLLAVCYRARTEGWRGFLDRDLKKLGQVLGYFMIGFTPLLILAVRDTVYYGEGVGGFRGWGGATAFQADLIAFVTPSRLHPFLGDLVQPITKRFTAGVPEATVFPGYLPLVLGLAAVIKFRKLEASVRLWSLALITFFILALGPFPRILGQPIRSLPLPYYLIMSTPVLTNFRVPSRCAIMVMLALAVLAAFSCRQLFRQFENRISRAAIFVLVMLVVALEYLAIPFPTFKPIVPEVYRRIVRDPEPFTVLEIPLGRSSGTTGVGQFHVSSLYSQTVHEKKIIGGHVSRISDEKLATLVRYPLLRRILALQGSKLLPESVRDDGHGHRQDLESLGIRYVVIYPPYSDSSVRTFLEKTLSLEKIYDVNGVVAFKVLKAKSFQTD